MNKGYIYALLAVFFFTFVPIFARILLPYIDAEPMNFFRFLFGALILLVFTKFINEPMFEKMTRKKLISYAFLGILFALVLYTYVIAISHTYIASAQFLQQLSPIFTFIFAYVFLKESVKRSLYYSLIVAMLGAFIILYFGQGSEIFETQITGNVIAIISGVLLAGYTTFSRHIGKNYPILQSATWAFIFATIFMSFSLFNIPNLSSFNWLLLIFFGIFSTAMPFILYVKSMKYIESQKASLILLTTIVTNPIAAFIFFREIPPLSTIAGGLLIALSLLIVFKS